MYLSMLTEPVLCSSSDISTRAALRFSAASAFVSALSAASASLAVALEAVVPPGNAGATRGCVLSAADH